MDSSLETKAIRPSDGQYTKAYGDARNVEEREKLRRAHSVLEMLDEKGTNFSLKATDKEYKKFLTGFCSSAEITLEELGKAIEEIYPEKWGKKREKRKKGKGGSCISRLKGLIKREKPQQQGPRKRTALSPI